MEEKHWDKYFAFGNYGGHIIGDGANDGIGIQASMESNVFLRCNKMENLHIGLLKDGIHLTNLTIGNEFIPPFTTGLLYEAGLVTTQQSHFGNRWEGSAGDYADAATRNNIETTDLNQNGILIDRVRRQQFQVNFDIDPAFFPPSIAMPNTPLPQSIWIDEWFLDIAGSIKDCDFSPTINPPPGPGGSKQWISNWLQIQANPFVLPPGSDADHATLASLQQQYDALLTQYHMQYTPIVLLSTSLTETVTHWLDNEAPYFTTAAARALSQQTLDNWVVAQLDTIAQLDSLAKVQLLPGTLALIQQYQQASLTKPIAQYIATSNEIATLSLLDPILPEIVLQEPLLQTIANKCLLQGGPAIHTARGVLQLLQLQDFNQLNCINKRRDDNQRTGLAEKGADWSISPNPARDWAQIDLPSGERYEVLLYNAQGQFIKAIVSVKTKQVALPIAGLSPGIYWVQLVSDSNMNHMPQKLIVH